MTVKELLRVFPMIDKIDFICDNCTIEEIKADESGSFRKVRTHYNEKVNRVFAISENHIRIDSE